MWDAADEKLRATQAAPDLEDERLDVLADPVVLEGRLLGRGQDRLGPGDAALADELEDDRPRLDPVDRAGDQFAVAAGELVEGDVALGLAQALEDDLLGRLGMDPAERVGIHLLDLDEVAEDGCRIEHLGLVEAELGQRVGHFADRDLGPEDPDLAGLAVDPDADVLVAGLAPVGGLDGVLDGVDQLVARNLLLGIELEQGSDEVTIHGAPPVTSAVRRPIPVWSDRQKKRGGSPTFHQSGR